ncbi:fungal-specific transcription factor domain-containing protein [Annulohypoxylon maeteangense]|uniref:fungal-specific transcription factor domain-containing protein n=1 Tax=Annulohypoxylon maeteangense TaxID=1927788 RepID=UPI00200818CD|nr:fungal-specific transcription factor domain-containing protein [Annulohypoxylon maeteangense]KAI0882393.1 fungal-specific transcription factor domain-containing protein [Annulohypoxylon maeteangense]
MTEALRPLRPLQVSRDLHEPQSPQAGSGPISTPVSIPDSLKKRAICSQCRIRKVRCDGRPNICQNCDRLGFECSFQQSPGKSPGKYVVKLPERRRRMQACIQCHSKKTRCLGELPSCSSCVRRNRTCVYPRTKKHGTIARGNDLAGVSEADGQVAEQRSGGTSPTQGIMMIGPAQGLTLDHDVTLALMEDYFKHLYPLPSFSFLHKPTSLQRCRDQTMNGTLKLAICAITALQLHRTALCHDLWAQQAEQLILQQMGRASIFNLQALLLIIRYRIESGEFPTAFMLAALAARTALALRLNYERPELPDVAQEARRRLFWALYLLDDFFCVGLREFELYPEETIAIFLPCDEDNFEAGRHVRTGVLRPGPESRGNATVIGLRGVSLRLTSVRRAVMRFNRRVGLGDELSSTIGESIWRFEEELRFLGAALRPNEQYSAVNLTSSEWQAQFIMLHMSWHQCHCDMYRLGLDGYSEAAPSPVLLALHPRDRAGMQLKCLEHARSIIGIVSDFLNHGDGELLLERDAAVCAFESARLLMFGSRAASNLDVAIGKAKLSLKLITRFFPYSASTQPLRKDLERLIASYSVRLALQTQKAFSEPEPPSARPSTKVSQYATSRQRLSVQSLLLQSDFVDDSNEIAGPTQTTETPTLPSSMQTSFPVGVGDEVLAGAATPRDHSWGTTGPGNSQVSPAGQSLDAGQEGAGLIFNPWMGFTGPEDMYGVSSRPPGPDDEF